MSAALNPAHPSLGDPGDLLEFVPLRPFSPQAGEESSTGSIVVKVPDANIRTIFAHRQWRAGMLMADLIFAQIVPLKGCDVLELGSGTGLPSIAAHNYGRARLVVSTDYDSPSLIKTLRDNVLKNRDEQSTSQIKVAGHTWGQSIDDVQDLVPAGSFDTILLADCIWDDLSHAKLLKSASSLLKKTESSRIIMVSGLHTGRDKIVSFLRRAHRLGLQLTAFPETEEHIWPGLVSMEEEEALSREAKRYASDEALASASKHVLELQLFFDKDEEESTRRPGDVRLWQARSPRLQKIRRSFVVEERDEEKKENNGVHIRNRWITFLALAWRRH